MHLPTTLFGDPRNRVFNGLIYRRVVGKEVPFWVRNSVFLSFSRGAGNRLGRLDVERPSANSRRRVVDHKPYRIAAARVATCPSHKRTVRRRKALVTTRTELMLMAALAIIGLSSKPIAG